VRSAIEDEDFSLPSDGYDEDGTHWVDVDPDDVLPDDGQPGFSFGPYNAALFWLVPEIELDAGERVIARTTRAGGVYVGPSMQPGWVYQDRQPRVPLVAREDGAVIAVRAYGGTNVEVELKTTTDELWMNLDGASPLDLRVGEASEMWYGVPLLNLTTASLLDVRARVLENDDFEATLVEHAALPAAAVTQVPFLLRPKAAPTEAGQARTARLRLASPSLAFSYERDVTLTAVDPAGGYWRTYLSPTDGSVQSYGVLPPAGFDPASPPDEGYAVVLSLHGAGVGGKGQAQAYSPKDWAFIIAPTNRHPFGFDWEEWGRFNALETLDDAMSKFPSDPTRVYLAGHSMGGHGTWHVGVTTPGRFATLGPSAGWESFYSYVGETRPSGAIGRARAHSDTLVYLPNLARRGVYIIHGDADDNVPVSEGRNMYEETQLVTDDVLYHEQPGAGHWWDLDPDEAGADCVDWDPLFEFMESHTLDPLELEFSFTSPMASYSPTHSFVTLESSLDPNADLVVTSVPGADGASVLVTTSNVRSLTLDGAGLLARGITTAVVDGDGYALPDGPLAVGPADGKRHDVHGPYNQVYRRPFCFVVPDEGGAFADAASFLASYWAAYGNGHACMVPVSSLTETIRAERQLVWVGIDDETVAAPLPITWNSDEISIGDDVRDDAALLFVFPDGEKLSAAIVATEGQERRSLTRVVPFSSRAGLPDWFLWSGSSGLGTGFFEGDWSLP
jgi:poly(3-hydroxybutyrate) depolymerase